MQSEQPRQHFHITLCVYKDAVFDFVFCTVHGRPSTVDSLNSCPTVKVMWVVLTEVEVLIDSISPSCVISTNGLEAAFTAIMRSITFTPEQKQSTHRGK